MRLPPLGLHWRRLARRAGLSTILQLLAGLGVCATSVEAQASLREVGLDVFGLSWHYSGRTYWDGPDEREYNERNPGIGLHAVLLERGRHQWMLKAGGYRDSEGHYSRYLGPVWQYRAVGHLSVGVGVLLFDSESYTTPVIPLPLATYRVGRVGINVTWIPASSSDASGAIAAFGTVALWRHH